MSTWNPASKGAVAGWGGGVEAGWPRIASARSPAWRCAMVARATVLLQSQGIAGGGSQKPVDHGRGARQRPRCRGSPSPNTV